jgi:hypothetical protein
MTERGGRTPHVLCNESLRAPQEGVGMWVEDGFVGGGTVDAADCFHSEGIPQMGKSWPGGGSVIPTHVSGSP